MEMAPSQTRLLKSSLLVRVTDIKLLRSVTEVNAETVGCGDTGNVN